MPLRASLAAVIRGPAPGSALYTPMLGAFAARIARVGADDFVHSVDAASTALADTAALFGLDAVTVGLDAATLAESAGARVDRSSGAPHVLCGPDSLGDADAILATGPAAAAITVAERLRTTLAGTTLVIGVIPSVCTLARQLGCGAGQDERPMLRHAKRLVAGFAQRYGNARVDALLLGVDTGGAPSEAARKAEQVVANTAGFFGIPLLRAVAASAGSTMVGPAVGALACDRDCARAIVSAGVAAAMPVSPGEAELPVSTWYTSAGELDPATPPEAVHELVRRIRHQPASRN